MLTKKVPAFSAIEDSPDLPFTLRLVEE